MNIHPTLQKAYLIGCKLAQIENANRLEEVMLEPYRHQTVNNVEGDDGSSTMRNEDERIQSEQGASYGQKHQMAISPEWSGT